MNPLELRASVHQQSAIRMACQTERHRQFTRWVEENKPGWRLHSTVKNAYPYDDLNPDQTSFADF